MMRACTIDIDGVLTNYPQCWVDYINKETKSNYKTKEQAFRELGESAYHLLKEQYRKSDYKKNLPVKQSGLSLLHYLKEKGYCIIITTGRPPECLSLTEEWLKKNNLPYDEFILKQDLINMTIKHYDFHVDDSTNENNLIRKHCNCTCFIMTDHFKDIRKHVERPFFSVCIETYNRGKTIYNTLRSLNNQTFKDFNVIIADNCSTDDTVNEIQRFLPDAQFEYIFIKNKHHLQGTENWNTPLKYADGRYIAILEGDDRYTAEHLEEAYHVLFDSTVGVYLSGMPSMHGKVSAKEHKQYISALKGICPPSCSIFINEYSYDAEYLYAPEIELYFKIANDGYAAYYNPERTVIRDTKSRRYKRARHFFTGYHDRFKFLNSIEQKPSLVMLANLLIDMCIFIFYRKCGGMKHEIMDRKACG